MPVRPQLALRAPGWLAWSPRPRRTQAHEAGGGGRMSGRAGGAFRVGRSGASAYPGRRWSQEGDRGARARTPWTLRRSGRGMGPYSGSSRSQGPDKRGERLGGAYRRGSRSERGTVRHAQLGCLSQGQAAAAPPPRPTLQLEAFHLPGEGHVSVPWLPVCETPSCKPLPGSPLAPSPPGWLHSGEGLCQLSAEAAYSAGGEGLLV